MRCLASGAVAACCALFSPIAALSATPPSAVQIAFVPLDDRPAARIFPRQIAAICGVSLDMPPQQMLGHFEQPGDSAAIGRWLLDLKDRELTALVVSTDMLAYGGLVASRESATSVGDALYRLRPLAEFHRLRPNVPIYAFGTVMRLAPTATPQAEKYLDALTHYAQLGGALEPTGAQRADLAISRSNIPDRVFWDYVGARARDLDVDETLIGMAASGDISLLAITQDDAGSQTGLQVPDQARLHALVGKMVLGQRVLLNPGTDEMGMVMVVRAIEDAVSWAPTVTVAYPSDTDANAADPLEYLPIRDTIANIREFLKMRERQDADFVLAVNAPDDNPAIRAAFMQTVEDRLRRGAPTAVADLSFLTLDVQTERSTFESLEAAGLAAAPLAYASWNTTANSAGTALAQAAAVLIGRRFGTLNRDAAATFLFDRYVDDYGYRLLVRDPLQASLQAKGADFLALGAAAAGAESLARSMLWPVALSIFDRDFKPEGYHAGAISMYLPWQRTFEVQIDAALTAP